MSLIIEFMPMFANIDLWKAKKMIVSEYSYISIVPELIKYYILKILRRVRK